ncbi:MAG: DUF748 domain-containing protein [Nitrospirae bacterium]|nr:DUF748 domain-containing protein [Magnetococcales bacterium]HAT49192.1 hypothetical protein [Alphaproteobacteria bacterium]
MIRLSAFILVVLVLLLALMVPEVSPLINVGQYRGTIQNLIENITEHTVQLEKVVYNPFNGLLTLELNDLEIEASDPDDPPLLTSPKVYIGIRPLSLLSPRIEMEAITFVNPQINIVAHREQKLLARAQSKALASDHNMTRNLGQGLAGLTLGKLSIQNGMLTFIDRLQPTVNTLITDHIHLNIHALSPEMASPLTATARIHNIPFTLNGHIGPLPASLDPFEMPLLLSMEAKSIGLADLNDLFPESNFQARLSRGYLTTMVNGTLRSGLQTSSWMQLDGLELVNTNNPILKGKASFWNLGVGRTKKDGPKAMDIAFRQKSMLHMNHEDQSTLEFKEFFIYLNGTPVLETKGLIHEGFWGTWDLQFNILDSFHFSQLPLPQDFPLKGGTPKGTASVSGSWPDGLELHSQLDFSPTSFQLPPLVKKEGIPLIIATKAHISEQRLTIHNCRITTPDDANASIEISGSLYPSLAMQGSGRWQLVHLADYFPILTPWNSSGELELDLAISASSQGLQPDRAAGVARIKTGRIHDFSFDRLEAPFRWIAPEIRWPQIIIDTGDGRINGFLTVIADGEKPPFYTAMINPSALSLDKLPMANTDSDLTLEGLLYGSFTIQGTLSPQSTPEPRTMTGHGTLRLKPGRLTGIDPMTFVKPITDELTITNSEKKLYWDQAQAEVHMNPKELQLDALKIQGSDFLMRGSGVWRFKDRHWFDLQVNNLLPPWGAGNDFAIHVEGDDITKGIRVTPKIQFTP